MKDSILKPGCRIEELENRTAERLQRAAAMVIAWRLMARLGRELLDLPPEILFADVELRVLALIAITRDEFSFLICQESVTLQRMLTSPHHGESRASDMDSAMMCSQTGPIPPSKVGERGFSWTPPCAPH